MFLKLLRKKLVWTIHNLKNHENRYIRLEVFCSKLIAYFADILIVHCHNAKIDVARLFNIGNLDKIKVIPHGNLSGFYKNSISMIDARRALNLSSQNFVFLCLGRIRGYKGFAGLIDSFNKLADKSFELIIAGMPRHQDLVKDIEEKASLVGNIRVIPEFIPDDKIEVYMNAADVMVLPYADVLTSGAAILGMSFGKAIIAPRLGCIPELLDGPGKFLYDRDDKDGLYNAMSEALTARSSLQEMGLNNLQVVQDFDWDSIARRTYDVYDWCIYQ
jgi:glycosyltransferase involved in cell wall biosynthesis